MNDDVMPAGSAVELERLRKENAEVRRQFAALTSDRITPEDLARNVDNMNRLAGEVRQLRAENAELRRWQHALLEEGR